MSFLDMQLEDLLTRRALCKFPLLDGDPSGGVHAIGPIMASGATYDASI